VPCRDNMKIKTQPNMEMLTAPRDQRTAIIQKIFPEATTPRTGPPLIKSHLVTHPGLRAAGALNKPHEYLAPV
jgi:hypothetical protein